MEEATITACKHSNWIQAGYPFEFSGKGDVHYSSIYEVFCRDCQHYINLLSGKIIDDKDLIASAQLRELKND